MNCPYKIEQNDIYGRHLVASRDLKAGELILKEYPLMIGPPINGFLLLCFRCSKRLLTQKVSVCQSCNIAVVCNINCKGTLHTPEECNTLKNSDLKCEMFLRNPQIVMVVRCGLFKYYNEEKWNQLNLLESHIAERKDTYIWRAYKNNIEDVLKNEGWNSDGDDDSIQTICGILDVNSFEIRPWDVQVTDPSECMRGLYLKAALMTHDCIPNTHLSVDENFQMAIHVSTFIPKDSMILFNYSNGLQGSNERRKHLKEGKYFDCVCKRCSDNTEMGTNMSSLMCPKCKEGLLHCTEPLKDVFEEKWNCQKCGKSYKGQLILTTLNLCKDSINSCITLTELENTLEKLKLSLSPQHYLILELKQKIISKLSEEYTNEANLKKISLCEDLLNVLKVIEPGISRYQGIAYYELHNAKMNVAKSFYNEKEINTSQFLKELESIEGILKMALKSLLYEPKESPEGRLAQKAMTDMRVLRGTVQDIKQIMELNTSKTNKKEKKKNVK